MASITFWSRLEPRSRTDNLERSLQAQVRDPLWMLARQWQLGEFKGDDAGTPAWAEMATQVLPITHISSSKESDLEPLGVKAPPLEKIVESEPFFRVQPIEGENNPIPSEKLKWKIAKIFDAKTRAEMGLVFTRLLALLPLGEVWMNDFKKAFSFPSVNDTKTDDVDIDYDTLAFCHAMSGHIMDGGSLYYRLCVELKCSSKIPTKKQLEGLLNKPINILSAIGIGKICGQFIERCNKNYHINYEPAPNRTYWHSDHLEYSFGIAARKSEQETVKLFAAEYYEGQLDWHSFSVYGVPKSTASAGKTEWFIPTPCVFRGMPNSRWWEFEDARTDFGSIDVNQTDLAKMMLIEFALIHGNDWFLFPYPLEIGNLCVITELKVHDVFGEVTAIEPANAKPTNVEPAWRMFMLSGKEDGSEKYFFLPPSMTNVQESPVIEKVAFFRDEMANMVWAVEQTLPNGMREPVPGYELYEEKVRTTNNVDKSQAPNDVDPEAARVQYELQSKVPENWIPFVPVLPEGEKSLCLRRSTMPTEKDKPILPKSVILATTSDIFEEEIRRTGVSVTRTFQRARWVDGSTHVWLGRRKRPGRGEGSSGLKFDMVVDVNE